MSVSDIVERIPHRHSMLLLDRIHALVPGSYAVASKAVTGTEWCYESDASETPNGYPIGLLLESFNQTAALLTHHGRPLDEGSVPTVSVLASYTDVSIHDVVRPGDVMVHHAFVTSMFGDTEIFGGCTTVSGKSVLRVGQSVLARREPFTLTGYTE